MINSNNKTTHYISFYFNAILVAFLFSCAFPSFAQNDCGTNFDLKKLKKDHAAYQKFLRSFQRFWSIDAEKEKPTRRRWCGD